MSKKGKEDLVNNAQLDWVHSEGCTFFMTILPKKNIVKKEGDPLIDETQIQVHTRIVNKAEAQYTHSDFVPNTRGNMNKLLKEQFKIIKDKLLDKRFG